MRKAGNVGSQWENKRKPARMGHRPCPLVCLGWTSSPSFVSSVRSSSVYPGLLPTYIHTYPATFFRFFRFGAMLPIYIIHSLITFTLIQCSIYRTEPGNTFAWFTLTTHACTNFFKILHGSSDITNTNYLTCARDADIDKDIFWHFQMRSKKSKPVICRRSWCLAAYLAIC